MIDAVLESWLRWRVSVQQGAGDRNLGRKVRRGRQDRQEMRGIGKNSDKTFPRSGVLLTEVGRDFRCDVDEVVEVL